MRVVLWLLEVVLVVPALLLASRLVMLVAVVAKRWAWAVALLMTSAVMTITFVAGNGISLGLDNLNSAFDASLFVAVLLATEFPWLA